MQLSVTVDLFSPRWGHNDDYEFVFNEEDMEIIAGMQKKAKCEYVEGMDPQWASHERIGRILTNDHICYPDNLEGLITHVWLSWKNGDINNAIAKESIESLADWINAITSSKPSTEFWNNYF